MAKVTVTICDTCKERIAGAACPVCGKDLCKPCTKTVAVEMGVRFGPRVEFFKGTMCSGCYKTVEHNYRDLISKLSAEVEPGVLRVLRGYAGTSFETTESPKAPEVKTEVSPDLKIPKTDNTGFNGRGGFMRAKREEEDYSADITKADIPKDLDVTRDL